MKKLFVLAFFLLGLVELHAQNVKGFEQKAKIDTSVSVDRLNAKIVTGKGNEKGSAFTAGLKKTPGSAMGNLERISQRPENAAALQEPLKVKILKRPGNGKPLLIQVERNAAQKRLSAVVDTSELAGSFISELKPYLRLSDHVDFNSSSIQQTNKGFLVRMTEAYKGIPIQGTEVILHFDVAGQGLSFSGNYSSGSFELDTTAVLSPEDALHTVTTDLKATTVLQEPHHTHKHIFNYSGPEVAKVIFETDGLVQEALLAYEVTMMANELETWKYYIDAANGNIVRRYSLLCSAGPATATATDLYGTSRTINTYLDTDNLYYMVDASRPMYNATTGTGMIVTMDANNTDGASVEDVSSANNTWNNPAAVSAHYNAGVAYNYFDSEHGRNSIDGAGGTIYSIVNVTEEGGAPMDNAYWNGYAMYYGNGNYDFYPLARSLDVAGHEMTHGVIQASANLEYYGESGAINESMADIFGHLMDSTDWLIGEDVVKLQSFPTGALRNMQDPHNGGTSIYDPGYQPAHVDEQYMGSADNAGVHINSGIPNHAFYILATAIGNRKAGKIFYKALTEYLTRSSRFVDLRIAVLQSARDLYGTDSPEETEAGLAFDAVGIYGGSGSVVESTLPVNPGQEFMLLLDTHPDDPNSVYRANFATSGFNAYSTTGVLSKPSVTDNGQEAVFVGSDHKIYLLELDNPTSPVEYVLQNEPIWGNVAISKDGNRIAAVTMEEDTSIYVYDFTLQTWTNFVLYNPTYSGVQSGGPVYADALEWDYTGEYLVYDAFNRITNTSGTDIEYWDVNFIRVWDKELNEPADGSIEKLFATLPEGVSIGNPAFSKNSPYILAFDYIDEYQSIIAVIGLNMETNEVNTLAGNNTLGFPSYSKLDDFVAFSTVDQYGEFIVVVPVSADKISPAGNPSPLVLDATYPVFYAQGERDLTLGNSKPAENIVVTLHPNPATSSFEINLPGKADHVYLLDLKGAVVAEFPAPADRIQVDNLKDGLYMVKIISGGSVYYSKLIKE